ncbi:heme-degrading protein [Kribbella sp. VKM Ac-2527]|uniref:Heme-degrading protein n=1 Tax=Kribbella caucasensis TaxID=2512215 RepID=A0A4R6KNP8_9ACTN|nr:heme-binding protein [Kribbella sp. VKM Ac-2527]TDO51740.1 heme-degrading protein [Kribbella sp. VKM Ac-2527]
MPEEPDFASFDHDDAWRLGVDLVTQSRTQKLPSPSAFTSAHKRVFHAALPGTSADDDDWVMRKTRIVQRFDRSSQDVGQTYAADDPMRFHTAFGLPTQGLRRHWWCRADPRQRIPGRSARCLRPDLSR